MWVKNCVSIREGSPIHYIGYHKIFWEKSLGASPSDALANTQEKLENLKKGL